MFLKHLWDENIAYIPWISLRTRLCWPSHAGNSEICILFLDLVRFAIYVNLVRFWVYPLRYGVSFSIVRVQYINILTWLRGFQDRLPYLVLFSLCPSLFWEFRNKRNSKNLQFWPKSLGAMLEYWYIERGLLASYHFRVRMLSPSFCTSHENFLSLADTIYDLLYSPFHWLIQNFMYVIWLTWSS